MRRPTPGPGPYKIAAFSWLTLGLLVAAILLVGCASASRNTTYASDIPEYIDRNPVD